MIFSDKSAISFSDDHPAACDVVVVGGGVIGTSTAYFLARKGLKVTLCEKGGVAGEQSSRNWGWIRQQGRDAAELPIVIEAINTWEALSRELDEDIGFTRQGVLYAAENEAQLAEFEQWMQIAQQHQLDTRLLSGGEVDGLIQDKPGQWLGAMFTPSDGRAEPFKAVPALARGLQKLGGSVIEQCAVRDIDMQAGQVAGVVTERGRIGCQSVVLAGGAWSSLFLANLGVNLPQLTVRATVARTIPTDDIYAGNAALGEVAIRRRQDGGYTIAASDTNEHFVGADSFRHFFKFLPALYSARGYVNLRFDGDVVNRFSRPRRWAADAETVFEKQRVLNPEPSAKALNRMRLGLAKRVPKLAELAFAEAWAGMIDVTPDVVPVMDQLPQHAGLFVATGFSGHGFGIGPGAGQVMADMVLGDSARHDLQRFRFSRFSDGSKMQPGPGL